MLNIFEQEEMIPHEFWFLPGIPLMVKSNEEAKNGEFDSI